MAYANVSYTWDTDTTEYAIPFEFLKHSHFYVQVDVSGTGTFVVLTQVTDYTIDGDENGITLKAATIALWTNGVTIVNLYRSTPIDDANRIVDFQAGSVLTEEDLDNSALQVLYAAQESADVAAVSMQLDPGNTHWEADNKKIVDVTYPTTDSEAATKKYVDDVGAVAGNLPDVSGGAYDNNFVAVQGTLWAVENPAAARTTMGLGTAAVVDTGTVAANVPLNSSLTSGAVALGLPIASWHHILKNPLAENTNAAHTDLRVDTADAVTLYNGAGTYVADGTGTTGTQAMGVVIQPGLYFWYMPFLIYNTDAGNTGQFKGTMRNEDGTTEHLSITSQPIIGDRNSHTTVIGGKILDITTETEWCLFAGNIIVGAAGNIVMEGFDTLLIASTLIRLGDT